MTNKKDLRGGVEKMRAVAQLLLLWADDLETECQARKGRKAADAAADAAPAAVTETPAAHSAAEPVHEMAVPVEPPAAEDVRALLATKCAEGYRTQVQALINSYGAAKFSEVDPVHYADLMANAALLGSDGEEHAG